MRCRRCDRGRRPRKWATMSKAELQAQRDGLRDWRIKTPMSYFTHFGKVVVDSGLTPYSYMTAFLPDMTDAELEAEFKQTAALGVKVISSNQTKTELAPRLVPMCEKYKIDMGWRTTRR